MRPSRFFSPESHVVSPLALESPNCVCSRGRRKSQSIIKTCAPVCASMNAVLMPVVVFPSAGWLEVIRIVFGGLPADDKSNDVRRCRYDSVIGERASVIIASAVVFDGGPVGGALSAPGKRRSRLEGIKASAGR